jgi:hypothetical protein
MSNISETVDEDYLRVVAPFDDFMLSNDIFRQFNKAPAVLGHSNLLATIRKSHEKRFAAAAISKGTTLIVELLENSFGCARHQLKWIEMCPIDEDARIFEIKCFDQTWTRISGKELKLGNTSIPTNRMFVTRFNLDRFIVCVGTTIDEYREHARLQTPFRQ